MIKSPMLASPAPEKINFPVFASPKIDGVRALVVDGKLLSRKLKPIPNAYTNVLFAGIGFNGMDGELVVGDPAHPNCMQNTMSGVMSQDGEPDVNFFVFDLHGSGEKLIQTLPYWRRLESLRQWFDMYEGFPRLHLLPQQEIDSQEQLDIFEGAMLAAGFEGVIIRDPNAPYKYGRSTQKEGYLLKVKRFLDSEAVILGVEQEMENTNEPVIDETGHQKRSSHKIGKKPKDQVGALKVQDLKTGIEFNIGSGFSEDFAKKLWMMWSHHPLNLIGRIVTYKYQPAGVKDKPRFPVFKSFRDPIDL